MKRAVTKITALLLLSLLMMASAVAAQSLAAAFIAHPAVQQMERERPDLSAIEWQAMQSQLQQALQIQPGNPVYLQYLGTAGMNRYLYASTRDDEATAARQYAASLFRQAISSRPSWPHGHVHYLLAKYRLGEIDEKFFHHLRYANHLGPWEAWVQQVTVELGLQLENRLDVKQREIFRRSLHNGVRHPDGMQEMLGILRRYQELVRVCDEPVNEGVAEYCRRYYRQD